MLLRAKSERVYVDAGVRCAGVVLPRLDLVKVGALTLREAVLAVKLELGSDDWVLAPAVHVEGGLGEDEGAGIGYTGVEARCSAVGGKTTCLPGLGVVESTSNGASTSVLEQARDVDEGIGSLSGILRAECLDGVRKSIDGISVVEWLSTKSIEEHSAGAERRAVVNVAVRLYNPDELLARVLKLRRILLDDEPTDSAPVY